MADEIIGFGGAMVGGTLAYADTQNGSYTTVAGVMDLDPNELQVGKVKKTNYNSANYAHEYQPGLIEPGELAFKILFKKATQTTLYTLLTGRTNKWWRIQLHDSDSTPSNWKCEGFLMSLKNPMPMEDNVLADLKVCLTGLPVYTAGT